MNAEIEQVCEEMHDAANGTTLDHVDQFKIALRGFADRISDENHKDGPVGTERRVPLKGGENTKVYIVFRVHGGPEAVDFDTICGVFRELGDAKACLGNEYRAVRPEDKWILSEDPPGNNNYMRAEVVQTDDEFDRFEITEQEIQ